MILDEAAEKESKLETMSQSTENGNAGVIPGFEVAASSISWSSALAEVSEVAALQFQKPVDWPMSRPRTSS